MNRRTVLGFVLILSSCLLRVAHAQGVQTGTLTGIVEVQRRRHTSGRHRRGHVQRAAGRARRRHPTSTACTSWPTFRQARTWSKISKAGLAGRQPHRDRSARRHRHRRCHACCRRRSPNRWWWKAPRRRRSPQIQTSANIRASDDQPAADGTHAVPRGRVDAGRHDQYAERQPDDDLRRLRVRQRVPDRRRGRERQPAGHLERSLHRRRHRRSAGAHLRASARNMGASRAAS